MASLRAALRDARYALPPYLERVLPGPGADAAAQRCRALQRRGMGSTVGYFQSRESSAEEIVAANVAVARLLAQSAGDFQLSVKAPPLDFEWAPVRRIAETAAEAGLGLMLDSHSPRDADRTLGALKALLREFPGTGLALPARWRRSLADAAALRDSGARIRLVKGEWADPEADEPDVARNYLRICALLAGRPAPVAVATHDPLLAEHALGLLLAAGTPCELEQLRGLPSRRTTAVAWRLGVPVRIYVPFGPGWWPYALDKALTRPYLPLWMIRDRLGWREPPAVEAGRRGALTA
jgi:proline dehydrogenase